MTIDHIGAYIFPNILILRIIGRIAFPIYAYGIVVGYKKTKNLKKYFKRLFLLAIIAQIPYTLLKNDTSINIIFTLIVGLLCLVLISNEALLKYKLNYIIICIIVAVSHYMPLEYNTYGILLILAYSTIESNLKKALLFLITLNAVYVLFNPAYYLQIFSLVAIPIILINSNCNIKFNKTLYRIYYPLHLSILYIYILIHNS